MAEDRSFVLSTCLDLARIGEEPRDILIEPDTDARTAIATQLGLQAVGFLSGQFHLVRAGEGRIDARLDLTAKVTQTCVVSLEPVEQSIAEREPLVLLTEDAAGAEGESVAIDPHAPDEIVAEGTVVDLGAILVEQLALALDPYPRRADAETPVQADSGGKIAAHPFAPLARLRQPR